MIDLGAWTGLRAAEPLGGGHRNEVRAVRAADGSRLVARRSTRTAAALAWELDLVNTLAAHGFAVPAVVRTADGRRSDAGVVVQTWVDGGPPTTAELPIVAGELRRLHRLTAGWPQRPGFLATRDLLTRTRVDHVDLDLDGFPGLPPPRRRRARLAVHAWEIAAGWTAEPEYARRRLAQLRRCD